jgi:2-hydroxy-3-oxopropionate reductase
VAPHLPLTATVLEMMTAPKAARHESEDHSGLVQYYERLAGTAFQRTGDEHG